MRKLGYVVNFLVYLSLSASVGLFLNWVGHNSGNTNWSPFNAAPVLAVAVTTIIIIATVIFLLEVFCAGNHIFITHFLSWFNGNRNVGLLFLFFPLNGAFMGFMLKGPWKAESWGLSSFVIFEEAFLAMYATRGVSSDVSKALAAQQLAYITEHCTKAKVWPHDYLPAFACGVSFLVCVIVVYFELASLRYEGAVREDEEVVPSHEHQHLQAHESVDPTHATSEVELGERRT